MKKAYSYYQILNGRADEGRQSPPSIYAGKTFMVARWEALTIAAIAIAVGIGFFYISHHVGSWQHSTAVKTEQAAANSGDGQSLATNLEKTPVAPAPDLSPPTTE